MDKYCHVEEFSVRYSDLDFKDELKLSSYLSFAQEAAGSSADGLGFGYAALKEKGLGFIIVSTYCRIFRPVKLGDRISVETWPLPPRHVIFERDYRIKSGNEVLAALASRWCLVDLNDFSLLPATRLGEAHENCPYNPEKSIEVSSWKIPSAREEGRRVGGVRVGNSHSDHYLHANNCRYADFFCDCFTMDELKRPVKEFLISYAKQAKEGDELDFFRRDDGGLTVLEARLSGEFVSGFQIIFGE